MIRAGVTLVGVAVAIAALQLALVMPASAATLEVQPNDFSESIHNQLFFESSPASGYDLVSLDVDRAGDIKVSEDVAVDAPRG